MIAGTIILEDVTITFSQVSTKGTGNKELRMRYTVADSVSGDHAHLECDQAAFLAALAIAVHNDGDPNAERDYPAAESVMPVSLNKALRWIP